MSDEDVEVVLRGVDAVNRRDADAFIALMSPDVEWETDPEALPDLRDTYRGKAEVREYFEQVFVETWESLHIEVEELTEKRIVLGTLVTARGKASGVATELRSWGVFWLADGKIARRQIFWNRDQALEAAGLRE